MIGTDTPMVLCVHDLSNHLVVKVVYLGYSTLNRRHT
jgi:hypothetical protein